MKDWINTLKTERKKILQQEKKNNKALSNLHELFDENVQLKEEIKKMRKEKQETIAKIKKAKIQQVLKFDRKRVELIEKFETLNSPCKTFIIVIFHINTTHFIFNVWRKIDIGTTRIRNPYLTLLVIIYIWK